VGCSSLKRNYLFFGILIGSLPFAPARAEQEAISPVISFDSTVCDLGGVGLGTKNTCEFKFTNTGQAPLKITNVKTLSVF